MHEYEKATQARTIQQCRAVKIQHTVHFSAVRPFTINFLWSDWKIFVITKILNWAID